MLKACVNGARRMGEHPALPVGAVDVARDVLAVVAAGADAVHLHVKDERGDDTLDGPTLDTVLTAVRRSAPGVPIGVTTGAWALPDPDLRVAAVRSWGGLTARPDFASVNWHEEGADRVAAALLEIGVGVEAGLWHADGVRAWLASPYRDRCLRVLVELPGGLGAVAAEDEAARLLEMIGTHGDVLLHGEDESAWPALRMAGRLGLSTRIGLEDVLVLPDGRPAADNAELVRTARRLLEKA
ncbi:3-keto-5-aminohexanoate cleavage protein [Nocardioides currus]|nr:3-keto-5-aminohexanoate cleavage protein [Nocardioides currus]